MQTTALDQVDTRGCDSISFAPPFGEERGMKELRVSVEPEIGDRLAEEIARVRPRFPLRPGKVQRPYLPDETLQRDRLFDWLDARASRRIFYLIAEAGFGKTTLVADFLRRSRLRTFWYRLDEEDTDGLVFIRYLVAACQAVDTRLLVRSAALLAESSLEPASEAVVLDTLLTEIDSLGEMPSALVLDDFHMVDSVPGICSVVERIIANAPARLKVMVASRRTPALSVAALRARGELAELGREELRFNESETDRLFRDSYRHPLEPDVLHDLQERTDGWAASLQLVKTAVDGRSPGEVRAFVRELSGAEGNLYDYLAEEVVGDLPPELRDFLVRTSILDDIEPDMAVVAAEVPPARARSLLTDAQRLGLMSRGSNRGGTWRSHPLVREFLLAHLEAERGEDGVAEMHRRLAAVMEPRSWRLAARHWAAAGDATEVRRVVCAATPTIIGTGDLAAADEFVTRFPDPAPNPWFSIIQSRLHAAAGRYDEAAAVALEAETAAAHLEQAGQSFNLVRALNSLHLVIQRHDPEARLFAACEELAASGDDELQSIAESARLMCAASDSGSLDSLCELLARTAILNRQHNHPRHEGISLLNLSFAEIGRGNHDAAAASAGAALALLLTGGNSADISAAHVTAARGLAHSGLWVDTLSHLRAVTGERNEWVEPDAVAEAAEVYAMYGDPAQGHQLLEQAQAAHPGWSDSPYWIQVAARLQLEHQGPAQAAERLSYVGTHSMSPGFASAVRSLGLQIAASTDSANTALETRFAEDLRFAERQQAWFWQKTIRLTQALVSGRNELVAHVSSLVESDTGYLTIQAELVLRRLADLEDRGFDLVRAAVMQRPDRWRWALRNSAIRGRQPQGRYWASSPSS